jgi:four helix bundle protein
MARVMTKTFDLEERTFQFGKACGLLIISLSRNFISIEIGRQLLRSACSVGAKYIEANESLGEKDFKMHLKICRKEAKESAFWLRMLKDIKVVENVNEINILIVESCELRNIFSSILNR